MQAMVKPKDGPAKQQSVWPFVGPKTTGKVLFVSANPFTLDCFLNQG